jgi:phenylpropionate dioxygenase-like ring-hydroxylating dioxygenase large terminal subunit
MTNVQDKSGIDEKATNAKRVVPPGPTRVHAAPPVPSRPITAERYISEEWMQRESDVMWSKAWLFACLESDLGIPGQYVVFNLGRESILVTRNDDGEVVAFYNVCQHRGARLMVNDRSWVRNFVCPYHGWTYDHGGKLVVVPDAERFNPPVDCAERSLKAVRVEVWAGLVFVNMDPDAVTLREFLGGVAEIVDPYRVQDMVFMTDKTVQLDCNWKAVFDNFGELYHVEHIHPQHQLLFDCPTARLDLFANGHTGVVIDGHIVNTRLPIPETPNFYLEHQLKVYGVDPSIYEGRVLDIRKDIQRLRRDAGPRLGFDYSHLSDERLSDIEQYNLFPNTMLTLQPESALIMRARPHPTDPNKCFWDQFTFRMAPDPEVAQRAGVAYEPHPSLLFEQNERPEHDEFTQDDIIAGHKTMAITIDQDVHLIRDIQKGMHSRGFDTAKLCQDEDRIQHYHDWLNYFMGVR